MNERLREHFIEQAGFCEAYGSPFTARLIEALLGDLDAGGPTAALVGDGPGHPRADALCLRLTADSTKARELTQDVFVKAWEALPEFRGDSNITTWLHRIAVNAMLMQRRSDKRRTARVSLTDDEDDEAGATPQGAAAPMDVATAIDLERAVAALPPGVRRAFVLPDVEGYSHEESASMTGLAAGTLRAQLHRARQLLIRTLSS